MREGEGGGGGYIVEALASCMIAQLRQLLPTPMSYSTPPSSEPKQNPIVLVAKSRAEGVERKQDRKRAEREQRGRGG
jgi:hypothetical protein